MSAKLKQDLVYAETVNTHVLERTTPWGDILQYAHLLEVGKKLIPQVRIVIQVTVALLAQVWYFVQFQINAFESKMLLIENQMSSFEMEHARALPLPRQTSIARDCVLLQLNTSSFQIQCYYLLIKKYIYISKVVLSTTRACELLTNIQDWKCTFPADNIAY